MKNKKRKIIGTLIIIVGIIAFFMGMHYRGKLAEARENVKSGSSFMPDNSVKKGVTGAIESKIAAYDTPVFLMIVGGIVLVIVGVGTLVCCRKK